MFRPRLAVTLGDPRGIGPEVALGAIRRFAEESEATVAVVTPLGSFTGAELEQEIGAYASRSRSGDADAGAAAVGSLERAVEGAMAGRFHAIVTAPVSKPALRAVGWEVPGQTEMLRDLSGSARVGMLMAAERTRLDAPLRVLLATTHVALSAVPATLSEELLVGQGELLHEALARDWRIARPRLGLCALNPHASDGGLFGTEERRIFAPAVSRLRARGIDVTGPVPADTVFARALAGEFDAVVAPYHDVGMAAFKTISFGSGVNVTLGLPFVRTSPDHGTAFDLAGTGRADDSSMLEALWLAARLARSRFDTGPARA